MNQAPNTSGTTHTTITLLDNSSASYSTSCGSSINSNGTISNGGYADAFSSTTAASINIFNYKDKSETEFLSPLTCDDICLSMCRKLKISPITRLLFGLRVLDSENEWVAAGIFPKRGVRYCFRIRIKVLNLDTQLKNLDKEAYDYLYWQIRYDILNEKIPEIRHPEKQDNVMGFAVMDMCIDLDAKSSESERLEKDYKRDIIEGIEKNYKRYLPQKFLKDHRYFKDLFVKPKICATFKSVREKKIDFTDFKYYYISEVCKLASNYLMEMYVAIVNYIPNDYPLSGCSLAVGGGNGTRVFVKLDTYDDPEPGLKISREKLKWSLLAKVEDIFAICIEDDLCACLEIIGLPPSFRMQFESKVELESFITYIGTYSRLTANWMTDLCVRYLTPSLQELNTLRCHGPVGGAFSIVKLNENSKKNTSFIIRQCEKEYDVYYLDKCTPTSLKIRLGDNIITSKITKESDKWFLHSNEDRKEFNNLKDLTKSISAQMEWIPPSVYDKSPNLLICLPKNLQSKEIKTELSEDELRKKKVQILDWKHDLRWYENTVRICDNGRIKTMRGDWIQEKVCKDVSVMLKTFSEESDLKEFADLANFCRKIYSAQFLKLYGITLTTPYTMVMEYSPYGALDKFLQRNKDKISLKMLGTIVSDLVSGMVNLKKEKSYHGFIRCSNLFVTKFCPEDDYIETKIGDPGIRRSYCLEDLPWIPQEYYNNLNGARGDKYADDWAFATTVWEIFAYGKNVLEELDCVGNSNKLVKKLLKNRNQTGGILPKPSKRCPEEIYLTILDGWSLEATSRFHHITISSNIFLIKNKSSYNPVRPKEPAGSCPNDNDNESSEDEDTWSNHSPMYNGTQRVLSLPVGIVIVHQKLDEGHYGTVFKGELRYNTNTPTETVAVKLIKPQNTTDPKDFLREISIMRSLDHPNVVKIKYSIKPSYIIMEYIAEGSFLMYLKFQKDNLTNARLLRFSNDIAKGMDYLASKNYIHRDLAARNILVDKDHVKISDFGLAQIANSEGFYLVKSQRDLPIKWHSPESLETNKFSLKSDVWSYGVTMFETFSRGEMPNLNPRRELDPDEFLDRLKKGERLGKPDKCPQIVYDKLMMPCWQDDPKARPTFAELLDSIKILYEEVGVD